MTLETETKMEIVPPSAERKTMPSAPHRRPHKLIRTLGWIAGIIGVIGLVFLLYLAVVRPWHLRWGATDEEVKMSLPGDSQVANPAQIDTMAITIKAPAEKVWPWLLQFGYKRAGWYSYDGVEDALGSASFVDGHSSNRIVPELQNLKVGDRIDITGGFEDGPNLRVVQIEPDRALIMRWTIGNKPADGPTWAFILLRPDSQTTRLLLRTVNPDHASLYNYLTDAEVYVMYHKMMVGIKERAERNQNLITYVQGR